VTIEIRDIGSLPRVPAVYVMYGGSPRWAAYVGIGGDLRERISQHLIKRDSSIVTGTSAVGLNPDHVREIEWWEHEDFGQRERLEAAELVAFSFFDPALRSRGRVRTASSALVDEDEFVDQVTRLFRGPPSGRLVLPSSTDMASRLEAVERRLAELERRADAR
jgi:hypothetical protein